jgi:hypothetical protein
MVSMASMASLRFAAATPNQRTAHRVANVERQAGRARRDERNREQ